QAVRLVARVDALRTVAAEEIAIELQAREALQDRHRNLLGAARIHGRLEHDDVVLLQHLAEQLARALDRLQVGTLVAVDRRRHRHDVDLAGAQILEAGRVLEVLGGAQLGRLAFKRAVATLLELGDARGLDVETDRAEFLAELDGERQPDVAKTNDADLASAQTEFRHGRTGWPLTISCWRGRMPQNTARNSDISPISSELRPKGQSASSSPCRATPSTACGRTKVGSAAPGPKSAGTGMRPGRSASRRSECWCRC